MLLRNTLHTHHIFAPQLYNDAHFQAQAQSTHLNPSQEIFSPFLTRPRPPSTSQTPCFQPTAQPYKNSATSVQTPIQSRSKVPHEVISIIDHLNKHYLILPSDIPLKSKNAWRLLWKWHHSSPQSSHIKFDPPTQQPNHRVIYIQSRKWTIPELRLGRQKRVKPPTKLPIGTHISDIESFVTIDQTSCDHILYIAPDLHSSPHGSMDSSDLDSIHCLLDCLDIKNVKLNDDTAGKNGISKYNGIIFATPRSYILQRLDKKLIGGLSSFHSDLVKI